MTDEVAHRLRNTDRDLLQRANTADPDDVYMFERPEWQTQAACKGQVNVMFADGRGAPDSVRAEAINICAGCPVRVRCAEYAILGQDQDAGIWGGLSGNKIRTARALINRGATFADAYNQVWRPPNGGDCRICGDMFVSMQRRATCHSDLCAGRVKRERQARKEAARQRLEAEEVA